MMLFNNIGTLILSGRNIVVNFLSFYEFLNQSWRSSLRNLFMVRNWL